MSRTQDKSGYAWTTARLSALALAVTVAGAALGGTADASPGAGDRAAGAPSPIPAQDVTSALRVNPNPKTELVFLLDLSDSMRGPQGLYPYVQKQLPDYLATLQHDNSNDLVDVIVFGNPGTARSIYGPGAPTPLINLPAQAGLGQTDFGQAFDKAIDVLNEGVQKSGVQVGGVVLLSDGGMSATNDPLYDGGKGYGARGWKQLRQRAVGLPIPVTGYGVPLTTNSGYIKDQEKALGEVFGPGNVQTLPGGTNNLAGELAVAGQRVVYSEVTSAVARDSGRGVQVTWAGLPSSNGTPLDLTKRGSRTIKITLTSRTGKVPLYVTGLHLASPGGPVTAAGALPGTVELKPGESVTFPARLTWPAKTVGSSPTGGVRDISVALKLTGAVGSTWTQPLQSAFDDMSFSPGSLGGATVDFPATAAAASYLAYLLIAVLIVIAAIVIVLLTMRLSGTLILTTVDEDSGQVALRPLPVLRFGTGRLINRHGSMVVTGRPFSHAMTIRLRLADRPSAKVRLARGGRTMAAGIDIVHRNRSGGVGGTPRDYRGASQVPPEHRWG